MEQVFVIFKSRHEVWPTFHKTTDLIFRWFPFWKFDHVSSEMSVNVGIQLDGEELSGPGAFSELPYECEYAVIK